MKQSRIAFLSEMGFTGKVPANHPNMRTEFAWMHALNADHYNIGTFESVRDYDHIFLIIPKGKTYLSAEGSRLVNETNPTSDLLSSDFISILKQNNKAVYFVQEGPHWWFNDYEIVDQVNFYNLLTSVDGIFAHNESDVSYYKGMFPHIPVHVVPTLMIEDLIKEVVSTKEDKTIVGGNFARWYGGFESHVVANEFQLPVWGQTSHARREGENQLIQHLPRVMWVDWIKQLSTFKYAVHLMPTVAAGTFALNCAYLGIPCIGNVEVDTQRLCHPALAVDIRDVDTARKRAVALRDDLEFYQLCSKHARANYELHYSLDVWKQKMSHILNEAK